MYAEYNVMQERVLLWLLLIVRNAIMKFQILFNNALIVAMPLIVQLHLPARKARLL